MDELPKIMDSFAAQELGPGRSNSSAGIPRKTFAVRAVTVLEIALRRWVLPALRRPDAPGGFEFLERLAEGDLNRFLALGAFEERR